MSSTKIIAHRGHDQNGFVENTIQAFESAYKTGADGIELDVHLSKDKEWIIHHDPNLESFRIKSVSSEVLIKTAQNKNYQLALLPDVLSRFPNKMINIEIKPDSFQAGKLLAKLLINEGNIDKHYITSFKSKTLTGVRKISEQIKIGWITLYANSKKWKYLNHKLGLHTINPLHYILNKQKVYEISKNKIKLQPWTVNRSSSIQRFLKYKVDAIITDNLKLALEERNKFTKLEH